MQNLKTSNNNDVVISGFSDNTTQTSQISNEKLNFQFSAKDQAQTQEQLQEPLLHTQNSEQETKQSGEQERSDPSHLAEREEPAMIFNKNIPLWFKLGLPILMVLTLVLFGFSNAGIGASVMTYTKLFNNPSNTTLVKSFGLINTVVDMWKAGVYPLSILIAAFSGIWPYLKLILMLVCMFLNQRQLSFKTREKLLIILDTMGKWSLLDGYVMVLMIVAFYTQQDHVLGLPVELTVFAEPGFGIYSIIAGAMVSLVYTHILIYYHRKQRAKVIPITSEEKQHLGSRSNWRQNSILLIMLMAMILLLVGASIDSFKFSFKGAVTLIMNPEDIEVGYSMISLGMNLPYKTMEPNSAGIRFIQAMFFVFIIAVPVLFLGVLTVLWAVPLKIKQQKRLFLVAEIMNAWSNVEVMIISLIVSLVEIRQFVQFIIGNKCDLINEWLVVFENYGLINLKGEDRCYDVKIELNTGCALLFASAVLYFILGTAILRFCQKNMQKRLQKFEYEPQVSFLRTLEGDENLESSPEVQTPQPTPFNTLTQNNLQERASQERFYQNHPSNVSSDIYQSETDPHGIQGVQSQTQENQFQFNQRTLHLEKIKEAPLSFLERSDNV